MSFILTALKIIFLLGFLILIHESGHFFVAKACKIRVNQFAIGFGPKILKKQGKETLYVLRLIPLGGFVSMEGEEERSDKEGSFSNASILKRIVIVASGGLTNILFGLITLLILSAIFFATEKPDSTFFEQISFGFNNTINYLKMTGEVIGNLFTGKVNIDQLTGPIGISDMVAKTNRFV
ncbi:MAG: site-2 protease family protein [Clostridia bacterium]|nr:site-2 protease family protein [Clostridia bacterium]